MHVRWCIFRERTYAIASLCFGKVDFTVRISPVHFSRSNILRISTQRVTNGYLIQQFLVLF